MNPSQPETSPGMKLPPPVEPAAANLAPEVPPQLAPEQATSAGPETAPGVQAPAMPPAAIPLPTPSNGSATASQSAVSRTTNITTPTTADDSDLIEKEWVDKAKKIVELTRDDPYKQSEELTGVKADYMKQRYNKTIKLNK